MILDAQKQNFMQGNHDKPGKQTNALAAIFQICTLFLARLNVPQDLLKLLL